MVDDRSYFSDRAERELEMAQRATNLAAVKAHYTLAGLYLNLVHGEFREHPISAVAVRAGDIPQIRVNADRD